MAPTFNAALIYPQNHIAERQLRTPRQPFHSLTWTNMSRVLVAVCLPACHAGLRCLPAFLIAASEARAPHYSLRLPTYLGVRRSPHPPPFLLPSFQKNSRSRIPYQIRSTVLSSALYNQVHRSAQPRFTHISQHARFRLPKVRCVRTVGQDLQLLRGCECPSHSVLSFLDHVLTYLLAASSSLLRTSAWMEGPSKLTSSP